MRERADEPPYLTVRAGRQTVNLRVDDIRFIESLSDHVKTHTSGETVVCKERISHLAERLGPHGFVRIHRSFLVPEARVTAFTAEEVRAGARALPIGRSYRQAVMQRLEG